MREMDEQITINGITYNIVMKKTPESLDAEGKVNLAAHMREYNHVAQLYLQRPRGRATYLSIQHKSGYIDNPTKLF